jgi:hypothetical protein
MSWNQNFTATGLSTLSTYAPAAGPAFVKGKVQVPTLVNGGGASSVVVTVNQNGSPIYTGVAGAEGFYTVMSCALNDVIAVVFSSSAAADQGLNVIKSEISIGSGQ